VVGLAAASYDDVLDVSCVRSKVRRRHPRTMGAFTGPARIQRTW